MKVFLATLVTHGAVALAAYVLSGIIHTASGRGLWGILRAEYQIRQFSTYLLDALPFFILSLLLITLIWERIRRRWILKPSELLVCAILSGGLAIALHMRLFPTDLRGIIFVMMFSVLYAGIFPVASGIIFGRTRGFNPIPTVSPKIVPLLAAVVFAVLYVGAFRSGIIPGYLPENETYNEALEPTPPEAIFTPSGNPGEPRIELFQRETLPFGGDVARFGDINGDGWMDIVVRSEEGALELWLNDRGRFVKDEMFLKGVENAFVHDFYVADYDGDGRMDIIFTSYIQPIKSDFHNTFLKQLYWYPFHDATSRLTLARQTAPSKWADVTDRSFPEGKPLGFQKIEPILWFDVNGDGLLDFVLSQYPHGRGSLNKVYIQDANHQFHDRLQQYLIGGSERVFAEGSDVADFDGDGDIDLFANGYIFRNTGGTYQAVCGDAMPGMHCNAAARNDEGGVFEDVDGDGALDFILSYHNIHVDIPKYKLQLYYGNAAEPGRLTRSKENGDLFYGFNGYMRSADFDMSGLPKMLVDAPGRMLALINGAWKDLLPAITGEQSGTLAVLGWIDIDEDGDWDFIVRSKTDGRNYLFRNHLNSQRIIKISALGEGLIENQNGTTIRVRGEGFNRVAPYRSMGGYAGTMDPRIIFPLKPLARSQITACFRSLRGTPKDSASAQGVELNVVAVRGNCVDYALRVDQNVRRVDLRLIAGSSVAAIEVW